MEVKRGYELTLAVLKRNDVGALVGLLAQALNEPEEEFRYRTAAFLARLDDPAVDRLLVRRFGSIGPAAREVLLSRPEGVLNAAERLSRVGGDGTIRTNVIEALAALEDRRSIPIMLRYLDDPAAPVRDRARGLLQILARRFGTELAEEGGRDRAYLRTALSLALRGGNVNEETLRTLLSLGKEGFMLLLPLLRERASESAEKIVAFLEKEGGREVVACLFYLAASGYEGIRRLARKILKQRNDGEFLIAASHVIAELTDQEKAPLLVTLRYLRWEDFKPEDLNRLEEPIQRAALETARSFGGAMAQRVLKLVPFLKSRYVDIRAEALHALSEMPSRLIFPHLEPLLSDPAEVIALRATSLLDVQEDRRALVLLVRQLAHPCEHVREEAARKLSGRTFPFLAGRWEELPAERRSRITRVLARVDRHFLDQLRQELERGDPVRTQRALAMARETDRLEPLKRTLAGLTMFPDPRVRATAAALLGEVARGVERRWLERLLSDKDPRVVSNAIEALAQSGDRNLIGRLRPYLKHPNNRVRATAAVSLRVLGCTEVYETVRNMLSDRDPRFRRSGAWAARRFKEFVFKARPSVSEGEVEEIKWDRAEAGFGARSREEEKGAVSILN